MGKNNRERRAAKAKQRAKGRAQHRDGGHGQFSSRDTDSGRRPPEAPLLSAAEIARFVLVASATGRWQDEGLDGSSPLERLMSLPAKVVDREIEACLLDQVQAIWEGGWQPSELHRQGRKGCNTAAAGRLVAWGMAVDDTARRATTLDSRWRAQVAGLDLPAVDGRSGWVVRWAEDERLGRSMALQAVLDALRNVFGLRGLEPLLPLPGIDGGPPRPVAMAGGAVGVDNDPILERVRNLLAKAESTTFEAEATAFTAKAQQLITRHAINAALVSHEAGTSNPGTPMMTRVPLDSPYVDVKSLLLQTVAEATRCRAVFHGGVDLSTVVGAASDLAAVEMLFTSLLVQAQAALAAAAASAPPGTRTRSQGYRSAFLLSFTERIRDRLAEINDVVFAEAEASEGSSFLPVLRARAEDIDELMAEHFGELANRRIRGGYDAAGWSHGQLAADHAQLSFGDLEASHA